MRRDGIGEEEAKRRISAQMPLAEKVRRADFVIENNGVFHISFLKLSFISQLQVVLKNWNTKWIKCSASFSQNGKNLSFAFPQFPLPLFLLCTVVCMLFSLDFYFK